MCGLKEFGMSFGLAQVVDHVPDRMRYQELDFVNLYTLFLALKKMKSRLNLVWFLSLNTEKKNVLMAMMLSVLGQRVEEQMNVQELLERPVM